jgi:Mycothiol maleylpyruvate isomerase N-terminal domain
MVVIVRADGRNSLIGHVSGEPEPNDPGRPTLQVPERPALQVPGPGHFASDASLVFRTSIECCELLGSVVDLDWTRPIPEMTWNVAQAVAHAGSALIWYSMDLRAGTSELSNLDLTVKLDTTPTDLVATLETAAFVLASTIERTGPDLLGWHPWGNPDVSGFRAIACDEMLIHTDDAARGLCIEFNPSPDLALHTLERLFPWAPSSGDPWLTLKWANGRPDLPDRNRPSKWRWNSAPLSDWDRLLGLRLTGRFRETAR